MLVRGHACSSGRVKSSDTMSHNDVFCSSPANTEDETLDRFSEAAASILASILTRCALLLQLWSSLTADMLMAANGEAQERSMRCGLLVSRAWLVGSQYPWGA